MARVGKGGWGRGGYGSGEGGDVKDVDVRGSRREAETPKAGRESREWGKVSPSP